MTRCWLPVAPGAETVDQQADPMFWIGYWYSVPRDWPEAQEYLAARQRVVAELRGKKRRRRRLAVAK